MRKSFNLPSPAHLMPVNFALAISVSFGYFQPAMSQSNGSQSNPSSKARAGAPLSPITRVSNDPVLSPSAGAGFYDAGAFNPAAVEENGQTVLLFRAQDAKGVSSVGFASSQDGKHFKVDSKPVFAAQESYEVGGGVEDPRLQKIDGKFYLTYTAYNGKDAQLCLASSDDLRSWHRLGIVMPAYKGTWNKKWTKSGAIVPTKINGKYWMYYLGTVNDTDEMGLASSDDLIHWKDATEKPVLPKRENMFDSRVVEPGPAPLITDKGILLLYNGADDKLVYRTGWVLFDKADPTKVLARSAVPIFEPELKWEKTGQVPNVVFVEGLIQKGDELLLYYGGADKYVGIAKTHLQ
jgi:predicted GH43/DUF377 family glycosyl hydrolase